VDAEALVARCRRGDDLAWEALVRKYQGRVFAIALQYMRNREEARDAAQDVFIKVYQGLDRLKPGAPFLPWLLRLSRNCCIDRLRRLKVRTPARPVEVEEALNTVSEDANPEESWLTGATRNLVYLALGRLTEKNREILLLHDIHQLKLEEIADLLEIPIGTVKSRSNRARIELAKAVRRLDPSYGVGT
jgi:RNA polymerase sigma-70 factor (ECF subfamily)